MFSLFLMQHHHILVVMCLLVCLQRSILHPQQLLMACVTHIISHKLHHVRILKNTGTCMQIYTRWKAKPNVSGLLSKSWVYTYHDMYMQRPSSSGDSRRIAVVTPEFRISLLELINHERGNCDASLDPMLLAIRKDVRRAQNVLIAKCAAKKVLHVHVWKQ